MFARTGVLSLALISFLGGAAGLDLDVSSQDSIKSTAKTLAGGIVAAYKDALSNDSIPGLFPDPYYWWEAGAVLGGLVEYSYLTGDSQYDDLVSQGIQWQLGDGNAFLPANQTKTLGNDDQSTWGLTAMTAAEVGFPKPNSGAWVDYAANVFDTQAQRLDFEFGKNGTCGGGLRWQLFTFQNGYNYKNSLSNGNFFLLAARLAKFTGNQTYSHVAERSYSWAKDVGLVSNNYAVYDGAQTVQNCSSINKMKWTDTSAIYAEGAAIMYNLTNGAQQWSDAVKGFIGASSVFQNSSVLIEVACENNGHCDTDQRAFKGIAARSYARAGVAAPFISSSIDKTLQASAKGAASACSGSGDDVACKLTWTNAATKWESASAKDGNLGEVFGALEVVQGLLWKNSKALATGTTSGSGNSTSSGSPTSSGSAAAHSQTGAADSTTASLSAVLAVAFAVALSC